MAPRKSFFGWSDLPWAGAIALFIAFAIFLTDSGVLNQPYATFSGCSSLGGGFVIVLGWIRARNKVTWARKVPKVTARKVPKP
ncbi:MAG TPA: hypothetical protein VEY12_10805 [Thermoplasmata archaeon]|nr:hypothetical protein [Thermoplasmata archaeon]